MAVSGSGGWVPSTWARWDGAQVQFMGITQNKPKDVIEPDPSVAAARLLAGERVTIDVRHGYMSELRQALKAGT